MVDQLKQPNGLSFEGNIAKNWKRWLQAFEIFLIGKALFTTHVTVII